MFSVVFLSARGAAISLGRPVRKEECPADRTGHRFFHTLSRAPIVSTPFFSEAREKGSLIKAAFFLCQRTGPVPGGLSFLSCCHRCLSESYTTPPRFRYSPQLPALYLWIAPSFQPKRMILTSIPLCLSHFTQSPPLTQYLYLFLNVYMHTSTPSDTTSRTRKKPPPREALFISF